MQVGNLDDQNYIDYILRALGQVIDLPNKFPIQTFKILLKSATVNDSLHSNDFAHSLI